MKVLQIGNPILETVSKKVTQIQDKKIQNLIDGLIATCRKESDRSAGISAPQVGENLRISICRRFDKGDNVDEWEVMINPEIVAKSSEISTVWEGCLSIGVGDNALYGPVERPKRIKVKYLDREGENKEMEASDYLSHVVQHEIDHLNGILFIKHVSNPDKNLWTSIELDEYMEQNGDFPIIT